MINTLPSALTLDDSKRIEDQRGTAWLYKVRCSQHVVKYGHCSAVHMPSGSVVAVDMAASHHQDQPEGVVTDLRIHGVNRGEHDCVLAVLV